MGNEIQAVKTNAAQTQPKQEPSTAKRIAYTCGGLITYGSVFAKELAEGKNIYEAADKVNNDYKEVMDCNKKHLKENVKKTSEQLDKVPFGCGAIGLMFKGLDALLN